MNFFLHNTHVKHTCIKILKKVTFFNKLSIPKYLIFFYYTVFVPLKRPINKKNLNCDLELVYSYL